VRRLIRWAVLWVLTISLLLVHPDVECAVRWWRGKVTRCNGSSSRWTYRVSEADSRSFKHVGYYSCRIEQSARAGSKYQADSIERG
jgi:hypothetical protein